MQQVKHCVQALSFWYWATDKFVEVNESCTRCESAMLYEVASMALPQLSRSKRDEPNLQDWKDAEEFMLKPSGMN